MKTIRMYIYVLGCWAVMGPVLWAAGMPQPVVGSLRTHGSGCPQGSARGVLGASLAYGITFIDHHTEAVALEAHHTESRECHLEVEVTPAPGYQMQVDTFLLNGTHVTKGHAHTSVRAGYGFYSTADELWWEEAGKQIIPKDEAPQEDVFRAVGFGRDEGDWEIGYKSPHDGWSPCGQTVRLKGDLELKASRHDSPKSAEIILHNNNIHPPMVWGWAFQPCQNQPLFDGKWKSWYVTYHNQHTSPSAHSFPKSVEADLHIQGDRGTYRTHAFTGKLFDIRYLGREITGQWKADRAKGWFKFALGEEGHPFEGHADGHVDGYFDGYWGDARHGDTPLGAWHGVRSQ